MSSEYTTIEKGDVSVMVSVDEREVMVAERAAHADMQRQRDDVAEWFITADGERWRAVELYIRTHDNAEVLSDMYGADVIWPALTTVDDALDAIEWARESALDWIEDERADEGNDDDY